MAYRRTAARGGMGALSKGRYLSMTGLLLLVCCAARVISKGKSCPHARACTSGVSVLGLDQKHSSGAIPVIYAPHVAFPRGLRSTCGISITFLSFFKILNSKYSSVHAQFPTWVFFSPSSDLLSQLELPVLSY